MGFTSIGTESIPNQNQPLIITQKKNNKDLIPEPVLIPFIPLGIENFVGYKAYRITPRTGAQTLAWNIDSFDDKVPYMVTRDYEQTRTMTLGGFIWTSILKRICTSIYRG